ncbi:hypothetical protein FOPG_18335 [Fusarium oxysporum f. sp. conglutinans race 2 54008]|uniref:Uncharacterized protein n=1 Tax=Fusarium oxysporum f. sp. conglutinans race 2 54008 TaxID=1089457 RepID=X0GPB1_FUSOX|nr:hypothetical protein FOPG_18335 [Fusarium oxysporum f. sp. conglutinans race 2 54008]
MAIGWTCQTRGHRKRYWQGRAACCDASQATESSASRPTIK